MSLTQDDLQAIRTIVQDVVDKAIEESDLRTAAGFAEVHERIDQTNERIDQTNKRIDQTNDSIEGLDSKTERLEATTNRIENKLDATIGQVDDLQVRVKALEATA